MKLNSERNTIAMERRVMASAIRLLQWKGYCPAESPKSHSRGHHHLSVVFEHGHWWVTCSDCGGQWDAVDAEGLDSFGGFGFEEVTAPSED